MTSQVRSEGLPSWAKILLLFFVAIVLLLLAGSTIAVFWLAKLQKNITDPAAMSATLSQIADFQQPLPASFKMQMGIPLGIVNGVTLEHEPDHQLFTFLKIPSEGHSAQELLNAQAAPGAQAAGSLTVKFHGSEPVAGESMLYVVEEAKTETGTTEQYLFGVISPKNSNEAILLTARTSGKIDMAQTRELLSTIRGFTNHANDSAVPRAGSATDNTH